MSDSSPNATHSPSPNLTLVLASLTSLSEALKEATEILSAFCAENAVSATEGSATEEQEETTEEETEEEEGEERCYYFSPETLRCEQELLLRYNARDFIDLLMVAYKPLYGVLELMKSIEQEVPINSTVISCLGHMLEHVALFIFQIRDVYGSVEPCEE